MARTETNPLPPGSGGSALPSVLPRDRRTASPLRPPRQSPAVPGGPPPESVPPGPEGPAAAAGAGAGATDDNPDAPVRHEVAMPRDLFDRLTNYDAAPRCRYEAATGRAEFVAEPGPAHECRASEITRLVVRVEDALDDAGVPPRYILGRATRLVSDDGAFEPDESLFIDPPDAPDLRESDRYLDVRNGDPVPDLVVEIDRSVRSSHKLAPYFRMGVREAWTFSRRDGARIWVMDRQSPTGYRAADRSRVLPGLGRDDLDHLLAEDSPLAATWRSRQLARRIARTILARQGRG